MATTSLICRLTPENPKAYNAFQHNSSQMMLLWQPDIMAKAIVLAELDLHCVGAFTMGWDPQETPELELAEQFAGERMRCERLLTIVHAERAKNQEILNALQLDRLYHRERTPDGMRWRLIFQLSREIIPKSSSLLDLAGRSFPGRRRGPRPTTAITSTICRPPGMARPNVFHVSYGHAIDVNCMISMAPPVPPQTRLLRRPEPHRGTAHHRDPHHTRRSRATERIHAMTRFICNVVTRRVIKSYRQVTIEADAEEQVRALLEQQMEDCEVEYDRREDKVIDEDDDEIFIRCGDLTLDAWLKQYTMVRSTKARKVQDATGKLIAKLLGVHPCHVWSELHNPDGTMVLVPRVSVDWTVVRAWHVMRQQWWDDESIVVHLTADDAVKLQARDWEPNPDRKYDSDGNPCSHLNRYLCEQCGHEWADAWSGTPDDDCPSCGLTTTPYQNEDRNGGQVMLTVKNPLVIVFEDEGKDELICHLHPQKEKGHDYRTYGVVVADIVRHVANCFGVPESYVWNWVDKERRSPTAKAIRTGGKGL